MSEKQSPTRYECR